MSIKVILFFLYLSYVTSQVIDSKMGELKFMSIIDEDVVIEGESLMVKEIELIDVRCFWVKGWNVYDISNLERSNE
jgi:hypothetical protein